jgi:drug/metabolite transporter (DMT)-like permease
MIHSQPASGTLFALLAGLLWGLVFVAPLLLPDYPAALQSCARYLAFGLIALPLAWLDWGRLAQLSRADWIEALKLSLVGNLLYYGCLAAAIQTVGVPLPTMLIGTLLALGAVACWTWYPIRNARWLRRNPQSGSATWATAQGLTTLPLALAGAAGLAGWHAVQPLADASGTPFALPLGPRPLEFVALMTVIGLAASWLGTLLWNRASRLLPTSLAGQLIVFETLAALAYGFLWRGEPPSAGTLAGIALLVTGVAIGVRTFQRAPLQPAAH